MTPDTFAIIGTGLTVIAVQVGLFAWLRGDIARLGMELRDRIAALEGRVTSLESRVTALETDLRERMARLEGLFEGFIRREPPPPAS